MINQSQNGANGNRSNLRALFLTLVRYAFDGETTLTDEDKHELAGAAAAGGVIAKRTTFRGGGA